MSDDPKQVGKPDDIRINSRQDHELSYWSQELGVSREVLRDAVEKAGPMVSDVRKYLRRTGSEG